LEPKKISKRCGSQRSHSRTIPFALLWTGEQFLQFSVNGWIFGKDSLPSRVIEHFRHDT
jgi:hypothetical protein